MNRTNRILTLLLSVCLLIAFLAPTALAADTKPGPEASHPQGEPLSAPEQPVTPFTDVAQANWFYESVWFVVEKGLFLGTSETTFSPDDAMTRAMLWTVLARLDGQDITGGITWYAKAQAWVVEQKISDGTDPNVAITREQLATTLYRYSGSPEVSGMALHEYTDYTAASSWATSALLWAVQEKLISGKGDGILDPGGKAVRAEVAAILMRYISSNAQE